MRGCNTASVPQSSCCRVSSEGNPQAVAPWSFRLQAPRVSCSHFLASLAERWWWLKAETVLATPSHQVFLRQTAAVTEVRHRVCSGLDTANSYSRCRSSGSHLASCTHRLPPLIVANPDPCLGSKAKLQEDATSPPIPLTQTEAQEQSLARR